MKILCFSSYTSNWYFAFKEAVIAYEFQKRGHEVLFITSGEEFAEKSELANGEILRKEFGLKGYEISSALTVKDRKEIDFIVENLNKNNFENLVIDNVHVGKISLFEFLIHHKKMALDLTDQEWTECLPNIKNTLISFFACRHILEKENPDRIVMFSTVYSVNHAWEEYAAVKNIPVYFLENGLNVSDMDGTLIIAKKNWAYYLNTLKKNIWPQIKNIPVPQGMLSYVTDHFLELLKGKNVLVYSSPQSMQEVDIRKLFTIKDSQKILLATMSSYDEMFAGQYVGVWHTFEKPYFATQADWIVALVEYVRQHEDLFLIIRVHPREFPNKREGVKSEHAKILEKSFNNLPNNIKVNWPTDEISIYDLAKEVDVVLNSWSSVGVELSLLGIPVVSYSKELIAYPSDLNYAGTDKNDYFLKIETALKDGWSYEKIRQTYRWLALYYSRPIMRLEEKVRQPQIEAGNTKNALNLFEIKKFIPAKIKSFVKTFVPRKIIKKKFIDECVAQMKRNIDMSRAEKMLLELQDTLIDTKDISNNITDQEEDAVIRYELKRLFAVLYASKSGKKAPF